MKTVFIKINNISEINPSKISVQDLNNRYIDKDGKMFGLKYNRKTRKVSIIRIIRTSTKSADYFHQILKNQRIEERLNRKTNPVKRELADTTGYIYTEQDQPTETGFNFHVYINGITDLMQSHKDRLSGIMMNIKNSRMISEKDKTYSSQLNDLYRNLEIDGIARIDKAITSYKELKNYPRSISYYAAKLDSKNRRIFDELDTDTRKMSFVYAAEMFYSIKNLYKTLQKILSEFSSFINRISPGGPKDITNAERQYFIDAKTSVDSTVEETKKLLEDIQQLENYLNDPSNF